MTPAELAVRTAGPSDIAVLRALAERIWAASYADLLTPAQVEYMLGWMYGAETIAAEMAGGTVWQLAEWRGEPVGYLSLALGGPRAELQKLYLLPERHGQGLGQSLLRHARELARRAGATALRLRVNKGNARALRSYARAGFVDQGAIVSDIGGGFVMDDRILALDLGPTPCLIKICGLSTPDTLEAALAAGADQVGLVVFPRSPRHVTLAQASSLAAQARGRAEVVVLTVDADDATLDAVVDRVAPDWLQLHGSETPGRVAAVKARTGRRVLKALGIAQAADLAAALPFQEVADRLLFDAKPAKGAERPGGNGLPFDWSLLGEAPPGFVLSGGLTPGNVAEALRITQATAVDVSSGVETLPGRKHAGKIAAFVQAARGSALGRDVAASRG